MRVSKLQALENHQTIIDCAARLFLERGFDAVSIIEIMKEAGLTHGGFYGHFSSKDDLIEKTISHLTSSERGSKRVAFESYVKGYLSAARRSNLAEACPFSALGQESSRSSPATRQQFTAGLENLLRDIESLLTDYPPQARRFAAMTSFSSMVGAMMLARLVDDQSLSDEILSANLSSLLATRTAAAAVSENF